MRNFNILFHFRGHNRVASVDYSAIDHLYSVYLTDVELVLEFGNKLELSAHTMVLKQTQDRESYLLEAELAQQIRKQKPLALAS